MPWGSSFSVRGIASVVPFVQGCSHPLVFFPLQQGLLNSGLFHRNLKSSESNKREVHGGSLGWEAGSLSLTVPSSWDKSSCLPDSLGRGLWQACSPSFMHPLLCPLPVKEEGRRISGLSCSRSFGKLFHPVLIAAHNHRSLSWNLLN